MPHTEIDRIDGLTTSVAVKAPCRCATTAEIDLSGEQTIDGIACIETVPPHRVLVKNQTDKTKNGIYYVHSRTWERALDFNGARDARDGTLVWVEQGATYEHSLFRTDANQDPVIFEQTELQFTPIVFGNTYFQIHHERVGAIATGFGGKNYVYAPFEILGSVLLGNPAGSMVLDVWAKTHVDESPPLVAQSITAAAKPTLSSELSRSDFTLTGWQKQFATGPTEIVYNVDSGAVLTYYHHILICRRI
jgi:hypothetical protein